VIISDDNILKKYALALVLICECDIDEKLDPMMCDEIIDAMVVSGDSPVDVEEVTTYSKSSTLY
jgi:Ca2+-binding EF-hand superfamily protein